MFLALMCAVAVVVSVLGIVDPPAVLRWRRSGKHRRTTLAELLAGSRTVLAHPDEYLDELITRMSRANVAHIPVIALGP